MLCFRMKYTVFAWSFPASMLYNPQQPLPPARKPLSMIPQKQAPVTVMCQPVCLNRWNVYWYYLIIFGWFLPVLYESALQICSQKSNAPALDCYCSCPHLCWTRCPFVVGISEQWTDTSKYDPGTRPKPPGSLSKEQQASAATIWSHLMHDWLRDDTRIFESQMSKYCSCKNTTLLITSAYAKFKNSLLDQHVKWQFKIGPLEYAKTCKD